MPKATASEGLAQSPTWRLEWYSHLRLSGRKAPNPTTEPPCPILLLTAKKRLFRRRTPGPHSNLLLDLRNFDDSILLTSSDPQEAWDTFYKVTYEWLDFYYPLRAVTLTSREPSFMTQEIRYLLRRKSRLMRRGLIEEASALAVKIGRSIARSNERLLRDLDSSKGTKQLWSCVNNLTKASRDTPQQQQFSADQINDHYAFTSTDAGY